MNEQQARRNAAMLSVYYNAHGGAEGALDDENARVGAQQRQSLRRAQLEPMALLQASQVLGADHSEHAQPNRVRATAKLMGAGLHLRPQYAPVFRNLTSGFEIDVAGDLGLPPDLGDLDPRDRRTGREGAEDAVYRTLDRQLALPCERTRPTVVTSTDAQMVTRLRIGLRIRRNVKAMKTVIDPLRWPACSDFFEATYVAARIGRRVEVNRFYDAEKSGVQPLPGSNWGPLPMFEHFVLQWNAARLGYFKNLLAVQTLLDKAERAIEVRYQLDRALRSQVGSHSQSGGLDHDEGYLRARDTKGGWADVEGYKQVRYTRRPVAGFDLGYVLNLNASWVFHAFMDDVIHNEVCCELGQAASAAPGAPLTKAPAGKKAASKKSSSKKAASKKTASKKASSKKVRKQTARKRGSRQRVSRKKRPGA